MSAVLSALVLPAAAVVLLPPLPFDVLPAGALPLVAAEDGAAAVGSAEALLVLLVTALEESLGSSAALSGVFASSKCRC